MSAPLPDGWPLSMNAQSWLKRKIDELGYEQAAKRFGLKQSSMLKAAAGFGVNELVHQSVWHHFRLEILAEAREQQQ